MASTTKRPRSALLIFLAYFLILSFCERQVKCSDNENYILRAEWPEDCTSDKYNEFYDVSKLQCRKCSQNATVQSVTKDGLRCICNEEYKLLEDFGGGKINCEKCPSGMVASLDGWECTRCSVPSLGGSNKEEPEVACPNCADAITVDRELDGLWMEGENDTSPERRCVTCESETQPNRQRCTRCNAILRSRKDCNCPPENQAGGLCFADSKDLEPDHSSLHTINFESEGDFVSDYLKTHVRAAHAACAPPWSNLTACQHLANLCALLMYDLENDPETEPRSCHTLHGTTPCNDACSLHLRLMYPYTDNVRPSHNHTHPSGVPTWKINLPWLFYERPTPPSLLTDDYLTTTYRRGDTLNISLAFYNHTGGYYGYIEGSPDSMSLCMRPGEKQIAFGVQFTRECYLHADTVLNSTGKTTTFYDPYIRFKDRTGKEQLYAIPVLIRNLKDRDGVSVNKGVDRSKWVFTRRYFLLDTLAGRTDPDTPRQVVRFARSLVLHVRLQTDQTEGRIYVPWLEVNYEEVNRNDHHNGQTLKTELRVVYEMDLSKHHSDISIAIGVLSALSLILCLFQAYNYNRREGKVAVDLVTLLHLVITLCGSLAATFFTVILGAAIWWLLIYKMQEVMFLVPTLEGDYYVEAYIGSAFALKTLDIVYLLVTQCTTDLFLLDWERPREAEEPVPDTQRPPGRTHVSIWRTYFVANEWNELSTLRRTNMAALLLLVSLVLTGTGLENLARIEPEGGLHGNDPDEDRVEFSKVMRFGLSSLVYMATGLVLWVYTNCILRVFVHDRVAAFRDVCTMCNVSVFLMTYHQYGYYVHGRSVHGSADVGLRQMHENLHREEEDLCGSRGLEPGTDHQTYEIALPRRLREEYNRVLLPVKRAKARQHLRARLDADAETELLAYDVLNRFLQRFIEHSLTDVDYVITKNNLMERILDTEVEDNRDLGYFYVDEGLSFTRTLLCGHELSLHMYSLLLFTVVDLMSMNFFLAAAVTYGMDEVIRRIRYAFGRRNIAHKTLVDQRLLI